MHRLRGISCRLCSCWSVIELPHDCAANVVTMQLNAHAARRAAPPAPTDPPQTGTEKLDYWNQVDFKGSTVPFADGGGVDNLAVTPLLRRKVPVIVACIAGSEAINGDVKIDDWSFGQWDISGLFGATPLNHPKMKNGQVNGMSPQEHNRALQVRAGRWAQQHAFVSWACSESVQSARTIGRLNTQTDSPPPAETHPLLAPPAGLPQV